MYSPVIGNILPLVMIGIEMGVGNRDIFVSLYFRQLIAKTPL